jgi:hypothetical protein
MKFFRYFVFSLTLGLLLVTGARAQSSQPIVGNGSSLSSGNGATALQKTKSIFLPSCLSGATVGTNGQTVGQEGGSSGPVGCLQESIRYYTNLLLIALAIGAFFYLLMGAYNYVSAFGDESKIEAAKKTIRAAVIGLILATLAAVIVNQLSQFLQVSP